jgi:hypothetical protein
MALDRVDIWKQVQTTERNDMADSDAGGAATRAGLNVGPADRARLTQMIALAEGADDDRVRALAGSHRALLHPDSGEGAAVKADHLADELAKVAKAELEAGTLTAGDRAMTADATREAQAAYLELARGRAA